MLQRMRVIFGHPLSITRLAFEQIINIQCIVSISASWALFLLLGFLNHKYPVITMTPRISLSLIMRHDLNKAATY